jgi:acetyltransferase
MQTPASISEQAPPRLESARLVIETALMEGRKILSEMESKAILSAFRIPIAQTMVARSASEAMVLAEETRTAGGDEDRFAADRAQERLRRRAPEPQQPRRRARQPGWKSWTEVKKNRPDAQINGIAIEPMIQKANGRELVVGMTRDQVFGPTIVFGPGGTGVEAYNSERAVALPPLNPFLVADMLASTRTNPRGSASSATCRRSAWRRSRPYC